MKKHKFIEQTDDGFIYYSHWSNKCYKLKNIEELNEIKDADSYIFIGLLSLAFILCYVWVFFLEEYSMDLKHLLLTSSYFVIAGILFFIFYLCLGIKKNKMLNEKYKDAYYKDNKKPIWIYGLLSLTILFSGFCIAKDFIYYSNQFDFENQKFEKIVNRNNLVLKINPKYEESLFSRFAAYSSLEEYDKALVDINKLLEIRPQNEYYISDKAQLLYEIGRIDEAFELLNSEIKKNPKDIFYDNRSELYFKEGKLKEALSDLEKVKPQKYPTTEYNIKNSDMRLLKLSAIYEAQGDYCTALDNYNKLENKYLKLSLFYPQIKNAEWKCKK